MLSPAAQCACVCFPLLPVCVCVWLTHASLWKCFKEGNVVFADGPMRPFGCFLDFYLHFYGGYCVWRSLLAALKSYSSNIHLFVLSLLKKLPQSFKAVFWGGSLRAARWQCYHMAIQEVSSLGSKQFCDCAISLFPYRSVHTRLWLSTVGALISQGLLYGMPLYYWIMHIYIFFKLEKNLILTFRQ